MWTNHKEHTGVILSAHHVLRFDMLENVKEHIQAELKNTINYNI